ncbi:MAG: VOC family protein [Pseudomonadota bacterium]
MFKVSLIKVPVSDLARAVSFYEVALGVRAVFVAEEYGWAQLDGLGTPFALYVPGKGGGDRALSGSVDFHLSHPDVDALHATVSAVAADAVLAKNDDGSRSLEFSDPDGNTLKVMA